LSGKVRCRSRHIDIVDDENELVEAGVAKSDVTFCPAKLVKSTLRVIQVDCSPPVLNTTVLLLS